MSEQSQKELLEQTDQCVKCGLCLSTCPTYLIYQNEADSPRGRISLIQGLLNHEISSDNPDLNRHLNQCLQCGNCETACPSGVQYNFILDAIKSQSLRSYFSRWQLSFLSSPTAFRSGLSFARFIPRSFADWIPGFFGLLLKNKPYPSQKRKVLSKTRKLSHTSKGRIGIFTGCVGQTTDQDAIETTTLLLEKLGYYVSFVKKQVCCGAMYQHEGYSKESALLQKRNQYAFNDESLDYILYFASGCGAQLLDKQPYFHVPIVDVMQFLSQIELPTELRSKTPSEPIALHAPCTLRNQTSAWPETYQLVKRFAKEHLIELTDNHLCCGSAGLHYLKFPETADQMIKPKISALQKIQPKILLTSNTGCRLHFEKSIFQEGLTIQVMHPAQWVSELFL